MREGLAMYFDEQWQGKSNIQWCKELLQNGKMPNIISLIENMNFFTLEETISYPIAGGFTKYLIEKLTIKQYLEDLYYNENFDTALINMFGGNDNINPAFINWLKTRSLL